jgi:hypothetical protein
LVLLARFSDADGAILEVLEQRIRREVAGVSIFAVRPKWSGGAILMPDAEVVKIAVIRAGPGEVGRKSSRRMPPSR